MKNEVVKKGNCTQYKIFHKKSDKKNGKCLFVYDYGDKLYFNLLDYYPDGNKLKNDITKLCLKPAKIGYNFYRSYNGKVFNQSNSIPILLGKFDENSKTTERLKNVLKSFAKRNNLSFNENLSHQRILLQFCYPCLDFLPDIHYGGIGNFSRFARRSKNVKELFKLNFGIDDNRFIDNTIFILNESNSSPNVVFGKGYISKNIYTPEEIGRFISPDFNGFFLKRENITDCKYVLRKSNKQVRKNIFDSDNFLGLSNPFQNISKKIKELKLNVNKIFDADIDLEINSINNKIIKDNKDLDIPDEYLDLEGETVSVDGVEYLIHFPLSVSEIDTLHYDNKALYLILINKKADTAMHLFLDERSKKIRYVGGNEGYNFGRNYEELRELLWN